MKLLAYFEIEDHKGLGLHSTVLMKIEGYHCARELGQLDSGACSLGEELLAF
jgi:hypothetical protein